MSTTFKACVKLAAEELIQKGLTPREPGAWATQLEYLAILLAKSPELRELCKEADPDLFSAPLNPYAPGGSAHKMKILKSAPMRAVKEVLPLLEGELKLSVKICTVKKHKNLMCISGLKV